MKSNKDIKIQFFKQNLIGCTLSIVLVVIILLCMSLLIPEVRYKIYLWNYYHKLQHVNVIAEIPEKNTPSRGW